MRRTGPGIQDCIQGGRGRSRASGSCEPNVDIACASDECERAMRRSGGLGGALGTPRAGNARACCVHSEDSPRAVRPSRVTMPPCNASRVVQDDPTARGAPVGCALAPGWLVSEVGVVNGKLRCRPGPAQGRRHALGCPRSGEVGPCGTARFSLQPSLPGKRCKKQLQKTMGPCKKNR